jgi:hypothetical protein
MKPLQFNVSDVIMLLYISLPSVYNINTLCTTVGRERFSVSRVDHLSPKIWPCIDYGVTKTEIYPLMFHRGERYSV